MMSSRNLSGMSPLVSIVVPIYNTAEYVEECIQSVLSQTYENKELILVNDGSTDGSGEICKRYGHLPNVRYLVQENLGVTAARRCGVEAAYGEWIMFVDSDDCLVAGSISVLMDSCDTADIIIGASQLNAKSMKCLPDSLSKENYLEMQYARELSASPCAKLFKRVLFDDHTLSFPRHFNRGEDYLMNLMLAINNQKDVSVCKNQVYFVRENPSSTRHTSPFTLDYMVELSKTGDTIVMSHIPIDVFLRQRVKQRMFFFCEAMGDTHCVSNPQHPFVLDIKRSMDEAREWRPLDRLMLSMSSPWAVKAVWNIRKVAMRVLHPSMIAQDIKRIRAKSLKA